MKAHFEATYPSSPQSLIGTWRRFGINGPIYEIVDVGRELTSGHRMMRIRVVETGEEIEYRFTDVLDDPREL